MKDVVVSCDPGIPGAVAIWDAALWSAAVDRIGRHSSCMSPLTAVSLLDEFESSNYYDACDRNLDQLVFRFKRRSWKPVLFMYENPRVFGSAGSIGSAQSGGLLKLVHMTGRLVQLFRHMGCRAMLPVEIMHWKGTLPKRVTISRVLATGVTERLSEPLIGTHAYDAVGIGLHALATTAGVKQWAKLCFSV